MVDMKQELDNLSARVDSVLRQHINEYGMPVVTGVLSSVVFKVIADAGFNLYSETPGFKGRMRTLAALSNYHTITFDHETGLWDVTAFCGEDDTSKTGSTFSATGRGSTLSEALDYCLKTIDRHQ